jgi:hypothetical protein
MPEPLTFDPQLEGLLQEIAADPDSRLLRLPRATRLPDLLAIPDPVTPARAGLSTAERHLIEVHRDELADVLRRACLIRFYCDDSDRALYVHRIKSANEMIQVESAQHWRSSGQRVLQDAAESTELLTGLDLIQACIAGTDSTVSITQLAQASQALQFTDVADDYIGFDQVLGGDPLIGEGVLWRLVARRPTPYLLSCAYEVLALSAGIHVQDRVAMERYRLAVEAWPERINSLMSWLYFAVRIQDRKEALTASKRLDDLVHIKDEVLDSFVFAHQQQDKRGAVRATHDSRRLALDLQSIVGAPSRRVLDAI